jgi:hypothetical protein
MNEIQTTTWDSFLDIHQQEEKIRAEYKSLGESFGLTYLEEGTPSAHFDTSHLNLEQLNMLIEKLRQLGELHLHGQLALRASRADEQPIGTS